MNGKEVRVDRRGEPAAGEAVSAEPEGRTVPSERISSSPPSIASRMHPSRNRQFPCGSPDISRAAMPVYRTAPPLPLMFTRGKYSSG